MATINIDGKDYDLDNLNEKAKQQVNSLQFVQAEIRKLEGQIAVFKTAAASYTSALKQELDN